MNIKILNYADKSQSGVKILKSSNSELLESDILDINDQIIFEPVITGAIPGKYNLYFSPIIRPNYQNSDLTLYYGNTNSNYEIKPFIGNVFKLIYEVECYEKCKTCSQLGNEIFYYCIECKVKSLYITDNGQKCEDKCEGYIYINGELKYCKEKCNNDQFIKIEDDKKCCFDTCRQYIIIENEEKYCIDSYTYFDYNKMKMKNII